MDHELILKMIAWKALVSAAYEKGAIKPGYEEYWLERAILAEAATDLLEALTDLLAMVERQTDFNDDRDGGMIERSRAAIAKAEGR